MNAWMTKPILGLFNEFYKVVVIVMAISHRWMYKFLHRDLIVRCQLKYVFVTYFKFYNCENYQEHGLSKLEIMDYTILQQLLKGLSHGTIN